MARAPATTREQDAEWRENAALRLLEERLRMMVKHGRHSDRVRWQRVSLDAATLALLKAEERRGGPVPSMQRRYFRWSAREARARRIEAVVPADGAPGPLVVPAGEGQGSLATGASNS